MIPRCFTIFRLLNVNSDRLFPRDFSIDIPRRRVDSQPDVKHQVRDPAENGKHLGA